MVSNLKVFLGCFTCYSKAEENKFEKSLLYLKLNIKHAGERDGHLKTEMKNSRSLKIKINFKAFTILPIKS